jgi:hypothetical protein
MSADDPVTVLSEDESWSLLSTVSLGRLVTILGGQPEIFPVNFVTERRRACGSVDLNENILFDMVFRTPSRWFSRSACRMLVATSGRLFATSAATAASCCSQPMTSGR